MPVIVVGEVYAPPDPGLPQLVFVRVADWIVRVDEARPEPASV